MPRQNITRDNLLRALRSYRGPLPLSVAGCAALLVRPAAARHVERTRRTLQALARHGLLDVEVSDLGPVPCAPNAVSAAARPSRSSAAAGGRAV